ncbi:MAG TPA: GNAT family N-acetyltransferase [Rhizomicrobium sp.]|jgi:ribosomal protein S18 acetylase RimI-like enzyme|nr:GNAT family N-acetyltransferase [Rhizomicrobium sp.]
MAAEGLRISFEPHNDEPKAFVSGGLDNYNIAVTGRPDWYPVQYYLRDADDAVLGGLIGDTWGGWLHITHLWIADAARGSGHARELMAAAEAYAKKRGCTGAYLETFSFQARPLYEKLGYEVVGQIENFPPGHTHYFLKKEF